MTASANVGIVVFDLGRVLIRIADDWAHACTLAGVPVCTPEVYTRHKAAIDEVGDHHQCGRISNEEYARQTATLMGCPPEHVDAVLTAYLVGPFEGVDALLDDLEGAGVRTACLSNTNAHHWEMMLSTGGPASLPLHRLTHQFASHLVGHAKPHAPIYEHLERVTGFRGPQIVFFDDLQANVDAALARGWRAHRIDPAAPEDAVTQARRVLASYHVLPG